MRRFLCFIAWLLSGFIGALIIPAALYLVAMLTRGMRIGHYVAALCGFSFYAFVPVGFVAAVFVALVMSRQRPRDGNSLGGSPNLEQSGNLSEHS